MCFHLIVICGCDRPATPISEPPTLDEAAYASFSGLPLVGDTIALANGSWSAAPEPGGSSTASVLLHRGLYLAGDVDGDGRSDAVVFLSISGTGTGDLVVMAALTRDGEGVRNHATTTIGDRVQIRTASLADGIVTLDVVQAGPQDAMCCPGELAARTWEWNDGGWLERPPVVTGRWSTEVLVGETWILSGWDRDEPKRDSVPVSLRYESGRISGSAGCNRYFATVIAGTTPGEISIGQSGSTKMLCPPDQMAVEDRYLSILPRVRMVSFIDGQLAIRYDDGQRSRSLRFVRQSMPSAMLRNRRDPGS